MRLLGPFFSIALLAAGCTERVAFVAGDLSDPMRDAGEELAPPHDLATTSTLYRVQGEQLVFESEPSPPAEATTMTPVAEDDTRVVPDGSLVLTGSLFYDDVRDHGNWSRRETPSGEVGARYVTPGDPPESANLLAALDVTVDAYAIGPGCAELIGSAAVARNGSFRVVATPASAACAGGIAVAYRLAACADLYCVSVADGDQMPAVTRRLWHPLVKPSTPAPLTSGVYDLGMTIYGRVDQENPTDLEYQAAAVFASLVDAARFMHRDHPIPFGLKPVHVLFPGVDPTRTAGSTIHIAPAGKTGWRNVELFHEYGHTTYSGGSGCSQTACPGGFYNRNGDGFWGRVNLEYPYAAYVEGYCDFIERAIDGSCESTSWDDNAVTPPLWRTDTDEPSTTPFQNGDGIPRNVTRVLCDLLDSTDDDDASILGLGDATQLTITQIQTAQTDARVDQDAEICLLIEALDVVAPGPGGARDVARQNGIDCGAP